MILFIAKSFISLLVVYLLYKLFFARENMPVFKRYFLLLGIVFSIIISLITIRTTLAMPATIDTIITNYQVQQIIPADTEASLISPEVKEETPSLQWIIPGIYFTIAFILFFRYIINLIRLVSLSGFTTNYKPEGYKIKILRQNVRPFSFLKTIYVSEKDYHNGHIKKELLIHELAHVKQLHSIDILFIELMQIIFWFNPILWLYKKEMRLNHEYLADRQVIDKGIGIRDYQEFILDFVFRNNSSYLASNLNYSFIKKRFIMLTKKRSIARNCIHASLVAPAMIFLAIMFMCSQKVLAQEVVIQEKTNAPADQWEEILKKHNLKIEDRIMDKESLMKSNQYQVFSKPDARTIVRSNTEGKLAYEISNAIVIMGGPEDYMYIESSIVEFDTSKPEMLKMKKSVVKRYKTDTDLSQTISDFTSDEIEINLDKDKIIATGLSGGFNLDK